MVSVSRGSSVILIDSMHSFTTILTRRMSPTYAFVRNVQFFVVHAV